MTDKEKVLKVWLDARAVHITPGKWLIAHGDDPENPGYAILGPEFETEEAAWQNAAESLPAQPEQKVVYDAWGKAGRLQPIESLPVEAKEKERYEASDEYIRGFERCKELAERIVDEHLGYLDRIGHLDPVTSVAEPKITPSTPTDIGCEGCDEPVYLTRDYGYSHCDTTLNVGCDARPKTNHPSVPKPQPESSSISSEQTCSEAWEQYKRCNPDFYSEANRDLFEDGWNAAKGSR